MPRTPTPLPITDTMTDPNLFGRWFAGGTWGTWQAVLKAAYGLPMSDAEIAVFKSVSGSRNPPSKRVKELWALCGRRAGKDSVASLVAAHAAIFNDYRQRLRPGERASILCLAVDRAQARIIHRYTRGYFEQPLLAPLVANDAEEVLELNNGCEIIIGTTSYRSIRGRTLACAILDEVCFWRDDSTGVYANPDKAIYEAILPSFASLDDTALLIGISTPHTRTGLAYERWEKFWGQDDDDILIVGGRSTVFNPTLPQRVVDVALARDREAAKSEWLGEWRDLESAFLSGELIRSAVDRDVAVRSPEPGRHYVGFVDPSGGRADSFTAAVAHSEPSASANGVPTIVLDALYEAAPPFVATAEVAKIAALFKQYRIHRIVGDNYGGLWPAEAFSRHQITYTPAELSRSEIYVETIPLFTSGRVRLLDHEKLIDQFAGLRRKVQPGGREHIDHAAAAHDDLSNAAAGALTLCTGKRAPMVIHPSVLIRSAQPIYNPWRL
jgi:hypothetical protein